MRYWEIDFARGISVVLMVVYHAIFDLYYPLFNQFKWLAVIASSSFILISGMSLSISYSRGARFKKFAKRGIKLLILAGIVTAASFMFLEEGFIVFGILHFFALSSFLIYPFMKYSKSDMVIFIGAFMILLGMAFLSTSIDHNYFVWLGLPGYDFFTFDFFPIFPWMGVMLIGCYIGNNFYPNGKRSFKIPNANNVITRTLGFLGKHSLAIYFIHQPIILAILYLAGNSGIISLVV